MATDATKLKTSAKARVATNASAAAFLAHFKAAKAKVPASPETIQAPPELKAEPASQPQASTPTVAPRPAKRARKLASSQVSNNPGSSPAAATSSGGGSAPAAARAGAQPSLAALVAPGTVAALLQEAGTDITKLTGAVTFAQELLSKAQPLLKAARAASGTKCGARKCKTMRTARGKPGHGCGRCGTWYCATHKPECVTCATPMCKSCDKGSVCSHDCTVGVNKPACGKLLCKECATDTDCGRGVHLCEDCFDVFDCADCDLCHGRW